MKVFQFHLNQFGWINSRPIIINGRPHQLRIEISDSLIQGRFEFEKGGSIYHVEFCIEELLLEGDWKSQRLILLFHEVPRVNAKGHFLKELGSSLVNAVGRVLDLESILTASLIEIPGLSILENDLMFQFQQGQAPFLMRLILKLGFTLRMIPQGRQLLVEIHHKRSLLF